MTRKNANAYDFIVNFHIIMVKQLLQLADISAGILNLYFFLQQVRHEFLL